MRTRTRYSNSESPQGPSGRISRYWGWDPWYTWYSGMPGPGLDCDLTYSAYEQIIDVHPTDAGRPYQDCEHVKVKAASVANFFAYWPGNDQYSSSQMQWQGGCCMPTLSFVNSILASTNPSIDWTTSVVSLARAARGLIETKTLLGVSLAELPKTVRMVKRPFKLLKPLWRSIARDRSARSLAKESANIWLEAKYGWGATYYDMSNFAKTCSKYMQAERAFSQRARNKYGYRAVSCGSAPSPTCPDALWDKYLNVSKYDSASELPRRCVFAPPRLITNVSCSIIDRVHNQANAIERLLSAYGISASNIMESIWELLPYSFVVDWFINSEGIFNTLRYSDALKTLSSLRVRDLGYSTKVEIPFTAQVTTVKSSSWDSQWYWSRLDPVMPNKIDMASGLITKYTRTAGYPPAQTTLLENQGLKLSQLVSGASLLTRLL